MRIVIAATLLLALPAAAVALATETFGNAPVVRQPEWSDGVLEAINLESRVYSYWVNGNENFFYRGNSRALNEALRKFAVVKGETHVVILMPGPGNTNSFQGQAINFDWQLHVPSGIYKAVTKKSECILTIHIVQPPSVPAVERKQIDVWVAELNDDKFAVRDKATQELAKLGPAIKPVLREALKSTSLTAEGRRRIEALLDKMASIALADIETPKGVKLADPTDLVVQNLDGLKHPDTYQRSHAVQELGSLADYSDKVTPALGKTLKNDKDEHVRRCAAAALAHIGGKARPALSVLKEGLTDQDD